MAQVSINNRIALWLESLVLTFFNFLQSYFFLTLQSIPTAQCSRSLFKARPPPLPALDCPLPWLLGRTRMLGEDTHLLHGRTHRPQHFSIPVRFFSASFMSALIWSIPSSIRSSCSAGHPHQWLARGLEHCTSNVHYLAPKYRYIMETLNS